MSASKLDAVYRSILITKFFTKGWGKPDNLRRLFEFRKIVSNREECFKLIPQDYPIVITKEEKRSDIHMLEGHFLTPLETLLPGVVPECAHRAHFQVVMPTKWPEADYKPMCVHLAGTGDHFFWRRRNLMAKPLLKEGIGAIILENPFYGLRKPQDQVRSSLHNVSDIFVMGGCLILETLVLLHWCERNGLGPLGVTGLSMGGHMASLAATNWPRPLVLVPCLSWSTASAVFTQGVMSNSINWELLESQFFADGIYRDQLAKMVTIVDEAFLAGRKFAQRFSKHNESTQNIKTFNLPAILSTPATSVNKFDITNPNTLSSCQGLDPETQKYSMVSQSGAEDGDSQVTSLESLKSNLKISNNLYKKITSDKTFNLEQSEINELNKLALKNVDTELCKNTLDTTSDTAKCTATETMQDSSSDLEKSEIKIEDLCRSSNSEEFIGEIQNSDVIKCTNSDNNNLGNTIHEAPATAESISISEHGTSNEGASVEQSQQVHLAESNASESSEEKDGAKTVESKIIQNILKDTNSDIAAASKPGKSALNILSAFPFLGRVRPDPRENWRNREALQFMRGVMDECTHLGNFSVPYDTSLIIAVCAKNDAYVPRGDSGALEELWPGAEVRYIDAGHVSAYVLHQSLFRSCVVQAFEKSKKKWINGKHVV